MIYICLMQKKDRIKSVNIAKYPDQEVKVILFDFNKYRNIFILPARAGRVMKWIFVG